MKHHPILRLVIIAFVLTLLCSSSSFAVVFYVKVGGSDLPIVTGRSWNDAFGTIAHAIDIAHQYVDPTDPVKEIWVASGIYSGSITLYTGISVYGGFRGDETDRDQRDWNLNQTVIYATVGGSGYYGPSAVKVQTEFLPMGLTVIDGFVITGAYAQYGGGIDCSYATATIQNNLIINNYADYGAGIYCNGGLNDPNPMSGNSSIINNTIVNNFAYLQGAGIFCDGGSPTIAGNAIQNNIAFRQGAGIRCHLGSPNIYGNVITGNMVEEGSGGGVYLEAVLDGSRFYNNYVAANTAASGDGGGLYCGSTAVEITKNHFLGNSASGYRDENGFFQPGRGGGVFISGGSMLFANNIVNANGASLGGSMFLTDSSTVKIINNTIASNSASEGAGILVQQSSPTIINNIVAFNSSGISKDAESNLTLRNNCVFGNSSYNYAGQTDPTGTNYNISADPKLAGIVYDPEHPDNPKTNNLHIQPSSPCLDSGDDTVVSTYGLSIDFDSDSRWIGLHIDIGADESDGTVWSSTPQVVRVKPNGNDTNDGSSWALAKQTLQAAIDTVAEEGGEVWVQAGQYSGSVVLYPYAYVYGGFKGTETERTARDWKGSISRLIWVRGSVVTVSAGYRVSAVDGFTIQSGRGTSIGEDTFGGGIYCAYACPIIANNKITGNNAVYGGAIYCDCASPSVDSNTIIENTATNGAGIYCDNYSTPTISANIITGNDSTENGGGILADNGSAPLVTDNNITGNIGRQYGGGIYSTNQSCPRIYNNVMTANTSAVDGAAICSVRGSVPVVVDNVITGNLASGRGGGIYCLNSHATTIVNNTFASNSAVGDGGGIFVDGGSSPVVVNNIITAGSSGICKASSAAVTFRNNCTYGNTSYDYKGMPNPTGVNGNLTEDPKLASLTYKGTHIQPDSPCIDKGDDSVVQPEWLDMDKQTRILAEHVDIGADESDGRSWSPVARIIRVSSSGNDLNDGSIWALPKRTIQGAIDAAAVDGGEVWVKAGTYYERIHVRPYVQVYGGFGGAETAREQRSFSANPTIIDGGSNGSVVTFWLGYRWSTIDGFTIRNGKAETGGGIYCYYSSPTIANDIVTGNSASRGSGIYCLYSNPVITDSTVHANMSGSGGGIFCDYSAPVIRRNTITGNRGGSGGGVICYYSSPLIANNTIAANSADSGSGIFCNNQSRAIIINNTISRNNAKDNGAGIFCDNSSNAQIYNNTIAGNASNAGGGIYSANSSPIMVNNIVAFCTSGIGVTGSGKPVFRNNCVFGNTDGNYSGLSNPTGVNGNISADPQFVSFTNGDLHIADDSPCIDKGDNSVVQSDWVDTDGKARIVGSRVDIGSDEWTLAEAPPVNVSLSPKDSLAVGPFITLTTKYSDANGYVDLSECVFLINTTFTGQNTVYLRYNCNDNRLYVRNDANTVWMGGYTPKSDNTIENSYCKLDCSRTEIIASGSTVTVNWKLQLKNTMTGKTCGAWMMVIDDAGLRDGWEPMASKVRISRPPSNVSAVRSSGTIAVGSKFTFSSTYSDPDGSSDLATCVFLINTSFTGASAAYGYYNPKTNKLYVRNDANSMWVGGVAPKAATVLENSAFKLYCAETTVNRSGNDLTVNWRIELKQPYAGKNCSVWLYVWDNAGIKDGWELMTKFSVGQSLGSLPPVNASLTPNTGPYTTGVKLTFSSVFKDGDGYANIESCYFLMNKWFSGYYAVYLRYNANENKLYVRNDANTSWGVGYAPGSPHELQNSQCKLYCGDTTITGSGDTLTVNWRIELKPVMSGKSLNAWTMVYDDSGFRDGWDQMGANYTDADQPPVNVSLSPNSGTVPTDYDYLFTCKYADPDGYTDLAGCLLLINTSFTGTKAAYVWYDAEEDKLYVRNDANTVWTGGFAPGSNNFIENSCCKLNCEKTTITRVGTSITVNWSITLKSASIGNRTCGVWMLAIDRCAIRDGWDQMGTIQTK